MNTALKVLVGIAVAVIVAASGFIGGFATAKSDAIPLPSVSAEGPVVGNAVDTVNELLQDKALEPPSETSATAGAIQGLLESGGDKYALYFDDRQYDFFNEESMGEFGGIGVVLGDKEGSAYVVEVFKDTPAAGAGVEPDDEFVEIDGVRRDKWTTEEVVKRVRGKEGTDVELTMLRPGGDGDPGEEYTVTITRAMIELPNIESDLKGDVGYIRLAQFNGKSAEDIRQAITDLEKQGAESFVLDLRDNPGGLLKEAVDVTSLFVESGVIVQVEERDGEPVQSRASGATATDAALIVLINENSASASEIVAGALQDYDRATLVGEKSFGKGSVQTVEELAAPLGGAVKFTTAHYLTPKGRAIDGLGLTPDVVVKMDFHKQSDESKDVQLKKALELAGEAR